MLYFVDCNRPLSSIYRHNSAQLNGRLSWSPLSNQAYLQIYLGKRYKVIAIATQGGTELNRWIKRYRIIFNSGATMVHYSELGSIKVRITH